MNLVAISFRNALAYRSTVIFALFTHIVWVLTQIALWRFIYRDEPDMITYMTAYIIFSTLIGIFYSPKICDMIADKVASGDFSYDLMLS